MWDDFNRNLNYTNISIGILSCLQNYKLFLFSRNSNLLIIVFLDDDFLIKNLNFIFTAKVWQYIHIY